MSSDTLRMYLRRDALASRIPALPQLHYQNLLFLFFLLHPPNAAPLQHSSHAIFFLPHPLLTYSLPHFHPTILPFPIAQPPSLPPPPPLLRTHYYCIFSVASPPYSHIDFPSFDLSPMAASRATLIPCRQLR
ncbi:hypothetical protein ACTXT7_012425 [Hymenolepis weldensis]